MKKILLISTLFCSLLLNVSFAKPAGEKLDQMVAVVNDDLITRTELDSGIKAAKMQMTMRLDPNLSDKEIEKTVLQQLINKKLQLQTAQQAGLIVPDKEVLNAIEHIASQNNVPVSALYEQVKTAGMSEEEYRREIHDQIVIQKLQQHELAGRFSVTPEEVTAYMGTVKVDDNAPSEYHLYDIVVPLSDNPTANELTNAKARAIAIKTKIENGSDAKTVMTTENKISPLQTNDLGWLKLNDVPTPFMDAVTNMKKNTLAGPIQTGNGFHVLQMEDVRKAPGSNPMATDRRTVEAMLLQKKFETAVATYVSKLRSTAFISTTV